MPAPYDRVVVVCPVTVGYERRSSRSAHWFIGTALRKLVEQSGLAKDDVDGLAVSSFTLGADTSVALTEHFGLTARWLEWLPTGGASGVMALRRAARAVQMGDANVVACIAGDANHADSFQSLVRNFSRFSSEAVYPHGGLGPNGPFALITDHYMRSFGVTREDFGRIAVAQRANARSNPNALLGAKALTMVDYLSARPIVEPLHLYDCVMPCAGGEGFLVMGEDRARALRNPAARILGAIEWHNAFFGDPVAVQGGWARGRSDLTSRRRWAPTRSTASRPMTTIRSLSQCNWRIWDSAQGARSRACFASAT